MKTHIVLHALLLSGLFASLRAEVHQSNEDLSHEIQAAAAVLQEDSAAEGQVQRALLRLLDVSILVLPKSEQAGDVRKSLEEARAEFKDHSPLSDDAYQHLARAYRVLNGGKDFQFPRADSFEEAGARIQDLLAAAIMSLKQNNEGPTCRLLLESVLMIITPIPK